MIAVTDAYSVEGITAYIRELFDSDPPLQDIWVRGEVSNMIRAASGHWYFTLKDQHAQLKCVMFRSHAERQTIQPAEGDAIQVHGNISVYIQRGEYQLYADQVQLAGGVGDLYQRFEQLKAQLGAEGLFDPDRKRPLPIFPLRIGVVTSPDAAAFRDVQHVLARRFPLATVILSPTLVQGNEAPAQIVQAIQRLNTHQAAAVILVCRGGGSIEDLWAFNDEGVARVIAASSIPVVSGVGHETDFTIADFVADLRAPTPSAAAEIATPDLTDLEVAVKGLTDTLQRHMMQDLSQKRVDLDNSLRSLRLVAPQRRIRDARLQVDDLLLRLTNQQRRAFSLLKERLGASQKALANANPETLLQRGYAIVTRSDDGKPILQESDAPPGTGISIRIKSGELKARVEDKDSHERYKRTLF